MLNYLLKNFVTKIETFFATKVDFFASQPLKLRISDMKEKWSIFGKSNIFARIFPRLLES